jgi:hypothetical protein
LIERPTLSTDDQPAWQAAAHVPAHLTLLWRILSGKHVLDKKLSEWGKVAEVAVTVVGTSAADKRVLSIMKFVTEQRPSLTLHLEAVVRGAEQMYNHLANFSLQETWQNHLSQGYLD